MRKKKKDKKNKLEKNNNAVKEEFTNTERNKEGREV